MIEEEFTFLDKINNILIKDCPIESHNAGILISERMCKLLLNKSKEVKQKHGRTTN